MTIALQVDQNRAAGLGASQAAAALGLDPYRSPFALWNELRGAEERTVPAFVQEAAEWGQALEPVIRGKYALATGRGVFVPTDSYVRDGWLRATPDGLVGAAHHIPGVQEWSGPLIGFDGLLQVKTCSAYKADEWATGVPPAYEVQVRTEMHVADLPWCDVACLIGGQRMVTYRVEREATLEAAIVRDLAAFWELVQSGREPGVDGSDAWRSEAASRMKPTKLAIKADAETEATVRNLLTVRKQIAALEDVEAQHKTELLLKLSAAGATKLETPLGTVTAYRAGGRTDWKGYALSLGGHATPPDTYKTPSSTWALRLPGSED